MDGELVFAEIFLDNVRVPVADRLGDEGQGWHVCMATAGFERGLMLRSPARYQVAASKLIALYEAHKDESARLDAANAVAQQLDGCRGLCAVDLRHRLAA